jgi:small subunit ribosomal protein S6
MRDYELMYIIKPDLAEEAVVELKERLRKVIEEFAGVFTQEVAGWGKKRMAYSIEDYQEGIYCLWHFQGKPETVQELDRIIKISDKILRHLIIRLDDK